MRWTKRATWHWETEKEGNCFHTTTPRSIAPPQTTAISFFSYDHKWSTGSLRWVSEWTSERVHVTTSSFMFSINRRSWNKHVLVSVREGGKDSLHWLLFCIHCSFQSFSDTSAFIENWTTMHFFSLNVHSHVRTWNQLITRFALLLLASNWYRSCIW